MLPPPPPGPSPGPGPPTPPHPTPHPLRAQNIEGGLVSGSESRYPARCGQGAYLFASALHK